MSTTETEFDADGNIRMDAPPYWRPVTTAEEFAGLRKITEGEK